MTDSPFPPFALPQNPSPPLAPEQPKEKKPRRVTKAKELSALAAGTAPVGVDHVGAPEFKEKPPRKKRGPNKPKASNQRAPKFDLQTILAATSMLKEADMPAFEKMIGLLQDAGKPGRARLLEALSKVFG